VCFRYLSIPLRLHLININLLLTTFKDLGLSNKILKVLTELGFEKPTEIQQGAIPKLLSADKDLIGLAQTGTGKTAAFGLPLLELVDPSLNYTQGLILAPTRELGKQIAEQLTIFSAYMDKVSVLPVYGGANIGHQIKDLRRTQHIIIATPGRLIDLIKRKAVRLENLKYLVLDEADEMLNMGFKEDLDTILSYTPSEKNTWLFSATMPHQIKKIVNTYMNNPIEIRSKKKNEVNANIEHFFAVVRQRDKKEALTRFLDVDANMRGVVFCRTRRETQELAEALLKKNYKADALHGDLSQHHRDRVMKRFKTHELQVLIATDVAARGIDVDDLTHVFHYSLPDDMSYYTHRSGRTARAGKKGVSIAFINNREVYKIRKLERDLRISFSKAIIPSTNEILEIRMKSWGTSILEEKAKKVDEKLLEQAITLFGNLSKEELIAKILKSEIDKLNLGLGKDLNDHSSGSPRSERSRGDNRRRGGNRNSSRRRDFRGRRDRDRKKKRRY